MEHNESHRVLRTNIDREMLATRKIKEEIEKNRVAPLSLWGFESSGEAVSVASEILSSGPGLGAIYIPADSDPAAFASRVLSSRAESKAGVYRSAVVICNLELSGPEGLIGDLVREVTAQAHRFSNPWSPRRLWESFKGLFSRMTVEAEVGPVTATFAPNSEGAQRHQIAFQKALRLLRNSGREQVIFVVLNANAFADPANQGELTRLGDLLQRVNEDALHDVYPSCTGVLCATEVSSSAAIRAGIGRQGTPLMFSSVPPPRIPEMAAKAQRVFLRYAGLSVPQEKLQDYFVAIGGGAQTVSMACNRHMDQLMQERERRARVGQGPAADSKVVDAAYQHAKNMVLPVAKRPNWFGYLTPLQRIAVIALAQDRAMPRQRIQELLKQHKPNCSVTNFETALAELQDLDILEGASDGYLYLFSSDEHRRWVMENGQEEHARLSLENGQTRNVKSIVGIPVDTPSASLNVDSTSSKSFNINANQAGLSHEAPSEMDSG